MNDYLDDQSLVIASMEHSQRCSFTYTTAPHIHRECPGFIILAQNSTYIEVFTTHINETWIVEHGKGWNGKYLSATREEMLNDTAVRTIIAQYNNSANNSMERSNENSSDNNVKIIVGVVGALLGPVGLFVLFWLLYKFCNTFKRWVNQVQSSCRECFANNDNGPNPNHEDIPLAENTNGHLRNQENQPKNEETLLNGSQV
ncbi:uncharacterized protein RB166_011084 [Leptodactylus fuscus]|uniref:uncharacterized protein LOC142209823 n=1 Tax=Leptodactylus fuscus TaxID=238119 RepID=UPI003F4E59B4